MTQDELEAVLFSSLRARGFGDDYIQRYRMMVKFQQQKRPLIILISGAPSTGKSVLAQQLASRLNLPNVLQTDALRDLLEGGEGCPIPETQLWLRDGLSGGDLISKYQEESRIMRRALDGDLVKCIGDGKSIIIEGLHLDPGLYLSEFGKGGMLARRASEHAAAKLAEETRQKNKKLASGARGGAAGGPSDGANLVYSSTPKKWTRPNSEISEENGVETGNEIGLAAPKMTSSSSSRPRLAHSRSKTIDQGLMTYGDPVFVPIVLRLDPEEYPVVAEEWLRTQVALGESSEGEERVLQRVLELQKYLVSYGEAGVPVMPTGVIRFQETLDKLHEHVLECIKEALQVEEPS